VISDFTKALEINPRLPEPHLNRGNIYLRREEEDQAISDFMMDLRETGN
jgi:regulator of sirC expression with transglutaminase-like and TPR domain